MLFANFLIGLREGLEASMVVMILVAFLVKADRKDQMKWVWSGVAAAICATIATFLIIHYGTKTLTSQGQELVGGVASLLAVVLVTWMLLWMRGAAKNMSRELGNQLGSAIAIGPAAVMFVAFTAVIREGIETALLVFDTFAYGTKTTPMLGLVLGIALSIVLATCMYFGAIRINLQVFFKTTGILLIVVAAGILRYGVTDLQEAAVLPGLNNIAFDISHIIVPGTTTATLLEGIFNLVPAPTTASIIAWAAYLIIALVLFLKPPSRRPSQQRVSHA